MTRRTGLLAAGLALASFTAAASGAAETGPPAGIQAFDARFALGNGSITVGTVKMSLQQQEQRWRFHTSSEATGVYALLHRDQTEETSWLAADAEQIRPLEYEFRQTGSRKETVVSRFNWEERTVRTERSTAKDTEFTLKPGTQDRLSVVLRLVSASRAGEAHVSVDVNEKGRQRHWEFDLQGKEKIHTEAGLYDTVKFVQQHKPGERHTISWLAPALDHLPVRIDQIKDGKLAIRMDLRSISLASGATEAAATEEETQ